MAITKDKKKEILDGLVNSLQGSQSAVFVNFHSLPVEAVDALRAKLAGEGVGYKVAKKTLLKLALSQANVSGEMPALEGEIAVAYADDLIAPAREVHSFSADYKDKLSIVGGIFDGVYKNQSEMMEIATIPPVPVLRGMFVNVINSPIQGFVSVLNQIAEAKA